RLEEDSYGFLAGIDATLMGPWRVGFAGGYRSAEVESADGIAGAAEYDQWHGLVYTTGALGNWRAQFGAGFSKASVETERDVFLEEVINSHLIADYDGTVAHAFGELSYVHALNGAVLEPFVGYSFVRAETDEVDEADTLGGGEAAALLISGEQNQ